jgi:hypothetical protein
MICAGAAGIGRLAQPVVGRNSGMVCDSGGEKKRRRAVHSHSAKAPPPAGSER